MVIFSSLFVNAGNGAVFAIVPLVKRRMTGHNNSISLQKTLNYYPGVKGSQTIKTGGIFSGTGVIFTYPPATKTRRKKYIM